MEGTIKAWKVTILFFGPLREYVGTERIELTMAADSKIENIIECFNLEKWLETGLQAAIDGEMCSFNTILHDGAEIALLPPVSGG